MFIYQCELELWENTFFSSREINDLYLTEALIGNYALSYALGLAQSPYRNQGEIYYYEHMSQLNERGIYVTPATIPDGQEAKFSFSQFNSIPDAYWYAMGKNCLVQRPDGYDSQYDSKNKVWYIVDRKTGKKTKERAANYPQIGCIKMMGIGTVLKFFVISNQNLSLPRYVRLGKFMSKAKIAITLHNNPEIINLQHQRVGFLLNPLDLPQDIQVMSYDTYNIHPVPLIRNAIITGNFFKLDQNSYLPINMKFGVDFLRPSEAN